MVTTPLLKRWWPPDAGVSLVLFPTRTWRGGRREEAGRLRHEDSGTVDLARPCLVYLRRTISHAFATDVARFNVDIRLSEKRIYAGECPHPSGCEPFWVARHDHGSAGRS